LLESNGSHFKGKFHNGLKNGIGKWKKSVNSLNQYIG